MAPGVMGCFVVLLTRELALKVQDTQSLMGLIWLRHACARMGHQIAATPMARYIQHGGRNQSVAVNSLSLGVNLVDMHATPQASFMRACAGMRSALSIIA